MYICKYVCIYDIVCSDISVHSRTTYLLGLTVLMLILKFLTLKPKQTQTTIIYPPQKSAHIVKELASKTSNDDPIHTSSVTSTSGIISNDDNSTHVTDTVANGNTNTNENTAPMVLKPLWMNMYPSTMLNLRLINSSRRREELLCYRYPRTNEKVSRGKLNRGLRERSPNSGNGRTRWICKIQ